MERVVGHFAGLLAAPPVIGLVMLVLLFSGSGSDAVLASGAATAAALVVAGALILVPAFLYVRWPAEYADHLEIIEGRNRELVATVAELRAELSARDRPPSILSD